MPTPEAPRLSGSDMDRAVRRHTTSVREAVADSRNGLDSIGTAFMGAEQALSPSGINKFTRGETSLLFGIGAGLHGEPLARLTYQTKAQTKQIVDISRAGVGIYTEQNGDVGIYFVNRDQSKARTVSGDEPITPVSDVYKVYKVIVPQGEGTVRVDVIDSSAVDSRDPNKAHYKELLTKTTVGYLENPSIAPAWIKTNTYEGPDRRGVDTGQEIFYGTRRGDLNRQTGRSNIGTAPSSTGDLHEYHVYVDGHGLEEYESKDKRGREVTGLHGTPETVFTVDRTKMEVLVENGGEARLETRNLSGSTVSSQEADEQAA